MRPLSHAFSLRSHVGRYNNEEDAARAADDWWAERGLPRRNVELLAKVKAGAYTPVPGGVSAAPAPGNRPASASAAASEVVGGAEGGAEAAATATTAAPRYPRPNAELLEKSTPPDRVVLGKSKAPPPAPGVGAKRKYPGNPLDAATAAACASLELAATSAVLGAAVAAVRGPADAMLADRRTATAVASPDQSIASAGYGADVSMCGAGAGAGAGAGVPPPDRHEAQPAVTSRFRSVTWYKAAKKWQANLYHNGKLVYLGLYNDEEDAARAADNKCAELGLPRPNAAVLSGAQERVDKSTSSIYTGVTWDRASSKWQAQIWADGKTITIGRYHDEADAARARDEACRLRGKPERNTNLLAGTAAVAVSAAPASVSPPPPAPSGRRLAKRRRRETK